LATKLKGLTDNMFKSARIKLTAAYLLIIMIITFSFSAIVYINVNRVTKRALDMHERRVETRLREFRRSYNLPPGFQQPFSEEAVTQVRINTIYLLVILNAFVLITSGGIAYWFAGKTLKPIEEMTNKQKQFIADAAHELKTPLTAMKTYLEVNKRAKDFGAETTKELIDSTLEDINSLTLLTNNLLKQSRYQNFDTQQKRENLNLKDVLHQVTGKLKSKTELKDIAVTIEADPVVIKANKQSIAELITVLLDNAIKFNKNHGTIDIESTREGKKAVITIKDSGIGIAKKDMPHIFDRFYKADTSRTKTDRDGFGLGLSIAKDIVENHKGNISVTSKKNKGTTFKVTLPLNP
jgi:two-component system, OmpR family, sensor histidine kinase CiaH